MQLNEDGTITIQVKREELLLPNPTHSELKQMQAAGRSIQPSLQAKIREPYEALTEEQKTLYGILEKQRKSKEDKETWEAASEEDLEAIANVLEELREVYNITAELCVQWWVDTIKLLTGTEIDGGDLAGGLANAESISLAINHFETTPFLSGLR